MSRHPACLGFGTAIAMVMLIIAGCARTVTQNTDDATITTRVRTALLNDRTVNGSTIDVSTVNRVVTLSGRVRTAQERERAVAIARDTGGVADVRSQLQIAGAAGG
jgi:hyperosmotically inducible periplasmic protein